MRKGARPDPGPIRPVPRPSDEDPIWAGVNLFLDLADGRTHQLGGVQFNDGVLTNLRRWAAGEQFVVEVVGTNSGGTSYYQSSEIDAITFRRNTNKG